MSSDEYAVAYSSGRTICKHQFEQLWGVVQVININKKNNVVEGRHCPV